MAGPCSAISSPKVRSLTTLSPPLQRSAFSFLDFYEVMDLRNVCSSFRAAVQHDTFIRDLFLRSLSGRRLELVRTMMDSLSGCQFYQQFIKNLALGQCKKTEISRGNARQYLSLERASNCFVAMHNDIWKVYNSDGMMLVELNIKHIKSDLYNPDFQLTSSNSTSDEIVLSWRNAFQTTAFVAIFNRHTGTYIRHFPIPNKIRIAGMSIEMYCERTRTVSVAIRKYTKQPVKIVTIDFHGAILFDKEFPGKACPYFSRETQSIVYQEGNQICEIDPLGNEKRKLPLALWTYDPLHRGNLVTTRIVANKHLIVVCSNHGEIHAFDYTSGEGHRFNVGGYDRMSTHQVILPLYLVRDKICAHFYFTNHPENATTPPTRVIYNKVGERLHCTYNGGLTEVVGALGNKFLTRVDERTFVLSSNLRNKARFTTSCPDLWTILFDNLFSITRIERDRIVIWDFLPQIDEAPSAAAAAAADGST